MGFVPRPVLLVCLAAALALAGPASAARQPIRPAAIELTNPHVRAGAAQAPASHTKGLARVIVTLELPPLAAVLPERGPFGVWSARRKLDVSSRSARAHLARIDAQQRRATAALRASIPDARIGARYRLVLNGMTVSLPATRLPRLFGLGFVKRVYPSVRYSLSLNRGPSLIGAPALQAATGVRGEGIKVAVVDDGVDQEHAFLDPTGYAYPAGFPKGNVPFATPKVIVARSFPGPGAGANGRQPIDRARSFHGTHVAGVVAGNAGTTAPEGALPTCVLASGGCHPAVAGLSGVAPRAFVGNYRVFTVPNPLGGCCLANTPEIVEAFEAAVADGMDVINFSGGGPQSDPASDALIETVANVARAGVVPVMSAGNDRDFFGLGTVGSPSTAPDAISVAAVANAHVFGRALTVLAPQVPNPQIQFVPGVGGVPDAWATTNLRLVDVATVGGADRFLCAALPPGSLNGAIALVSRGICGLEGKANRAAAAGAIGLVVADNRTGDASGISIRLGMPAGMISDVDGALLRAAMAGAGGRATIRVGRDLLEIPSASAGIPTSFSAGGLTSFGHDLKPDVAAPGANVLSSTLPEFAGSPFAVLDGTSFSAPHIAGAAALLVERHPAWSPRQVKSALMSTAGPLFGREAPVVLGGAGVANLPAADDPRIFTDPPSLSFRDLNVNGGAVSRAIQVTVSDAGGGGGAWQVGLQVQSAPGGVALDVVPTIGLAPGGSTTFQVVARAAADALAGDAYGFVVLRQGDVTRRMPYAFPVTRPRLAGAQPVALRPLQSGDTRVGTDRAQVYRWPTTPFGVLGLLGVDHVVDDDGKETVYFIDINQSAANFGVAVVEPSPKVNASIQSLLGSNAPIHPWVLGSLDENDVQGYAGTPVNVNGLMRDYLFSLGVAGAVFPQPGRYFVSVDSGRDPFTGRSLAGRYVLRSWVNDVRPPVVQLLTARVSAGRPSIAARVTDVASGVDPLSLTLDYRGLQIGATVFDPKTGVAVFAVPRDAPEFQPPDTAVRIIASDYQEAKNVNTIGENLMPNTTFRHVRPRVINRPSVSWLVPQNGACAPRRSELAVVASAKSPISSVGFFDGNRQIARVRRNVAAVYTATWRTDRAARGRHTLSAVLSTTTGQEARATRVVRVCR